MYTDGTADDVFEFKFNPDTGGELVWQYAAGVMVAKKPFSGIKIQVLYDFGANTIYFDGIQLYKEEFGNSYTYNDKGNVTSVKDLQGQTTQYEYASNNTDLLRVIQDNKAKVTYTYDDYHNVKTATTEEGIVYEFEYDAYGNNTSVSIGSGDTKITSIAEYTDDFNRLEATTNAVGQKTLYGYHPDTNVLEWVQYPMDTEETRTEYTYDEMYRISQAALTTDTGLALSAEYTYDNDLLMSIETASTTYDFTYGNFALKSSVDIGNWNLAEYSYESGTNRLLKLDYGNGDKVQYTYDDQGRVTKQTYEDNAYVTYKYDNSGALATVYDSETSTTSTYYYDFTDRMMKYVEKHGSNTHSVGYTYDDINNLTALVETINGVKYTNTYTYDEDNRLTSLGSDNVGESYTYDVCGRVTEKTAKIGDQTVLTKSIAYRDVGPGGTSAQPYRLEYTGDTYSTAFSYGYNTNGDIAYVNRDGTTTFYKYDTANQLIRENNNETGTTTLWTYDDAGNILKREVYPCTSGTPDPATKLSEVNYTYSDSHWGDLLTAYNGVPITHDGIGNPLNDGTWTYTWQHGRELVNMRKPATVIITSQPEDVICAAGDRCVFSITAEGTGLSYQWQYCNNDIDYWQDFSSSSGTTSQLVFDSIGLRSMRFSYRCVVTDSKGNTEISQVVRCWNYATSNPILIADEPNTQYCYLGDTVSFNVLASGTGLNYQWQYSNDGGEIWQNSTDSTATTSTVIIRSVSSDLWNQQWRCVLTDADGNTVTTRTAVIKKRSIQWHYSYNADGMRTYRRSDDLIYTYKYLGNQLSYMTVEGDPEYFASMRFIYDTSGSPIAMACNGRTYYYVTSLQGDIVAILNDSGETVVNYAYDAWGNLISTTGEMADTLGYYNPLRYRGYVYDAETELYYLQSRYYNPEIGRFINSDGLVTTGQGLLGNNMFAYCGNNPIIRIDPNGCGWRLALAIVGGAVISLGTSWLVSWACGDDFTVLDGINNVNKYKYISAKIIAIP